MAKGKEVEITQKRGLRIALQKLALDLEAEESRPGCFDPALTLRISNLARDIERFSRNRDG